LIKEDALIMRVLFVVFMLLMAACSPPTANVNGGSVTIRLEDQYILMENPADGTVIYSELLYASGVVQREARSGFRLALVDAAEQTIAETVIYPDEHATWRVELPHTYQGEPSEMTLLGLPLDAESEQVYSSTSLIIAGLQYRPEGTFGSIRLPSDGMTVGGESILVEGTLSGLGDIPVRIKLMRPDDLQPLDSVEVGSSSPFVLDETPWRVALSTAFYIGPAQLVLVSDTDEVLAEIDITITEAAG
jgi:hypothetical protein